MLAAFRSTTYFQLRLVVLVARVSALALVIGPV